MMFAKTNFLKSVTLAVALATSAHAHRAWLLPSATVFSGDDKWVTIDAAISNDLFYFEHVPMRLENLTAIAPDGSVLKPQFLNTGKYRSTFDVELEKSGTYKFAVVNQSVMASWEENGETKRWRGPAANADKEIPANAAKLQKSGMSQRIEVFVTAGKPTRKVLEPTGKGLELVAETHPNDLFAGEKAKFGFLVDGKPAANITVTVAPGGKRYRDNLKELQLKTDADGMFTVPFTEAGMYWLNATANVGGSRASYVATLEVLPQ
ncbi:ABC transporter permease [Bryobacterales bacterium F-183]|nr:ABC transporter permease [Bryobacterales bacterium F-183]